MTQRGRGRPKLDRPNKDFGTPELQLKRTHHVTEEALDGYLRRNIISSNQHWCGVHFRWLHTLRHGIPNVKAVDTTHMGGRECNLDNLEWKILREEELASAGLLLRKNRCYESVLAVCVFNEKLALSQNLNQIHHPVHLSIEKYIQSFINGMDLLETLWFSNRGKCTQKGWE